MGIGYFVYSFFGNGSEALLTVLGLILLIFAVLMSLVVINHMLKRHIYIHSMYLQELYKLNQEYSCVFQNYLGTFEFDHQCNSKQQFDKTNYYKLFHDYCADNKQYLTSIVPIAEKNFYYYNEYCDKANDILNIKKSNYKNALMRALEIQVFKNIMLTPSTDIEITVSSSYTSPQGRNSYCDSRTYALRDVNACLNEISKENDFERQKRRERALLNDSLRYDILKRDRFTCAICGATKDDGAKLHVDHIKPIAKGGKTVPENLRTLCDRCNLGKKAKYDPNGLN
jgi:5-methylcytosine-specific restriction endonuclease McrA